MNLVVLYRALSHDNLRLVPNQRDWEIEVADFVHRGEQAVEDTAGCPITMQSFHGQQQRNVTHANVSFPNLVAATVISACRLGRKKCQIFPEYEKKKVISHTLVCRITV